MKNRHPLLALILLFSLQECKSPTDAPKINPIVPGPTGEMTIISISPETFYADDEITIFGTGFNTDIAKNLVEMGSAGIGPFQPFNKTFDTDPSFTVLSATATKIVAKAVEPSTIDFKIYYDAAYRIQVTNLDKSALGAIKHSKRLMSFNLSLADAIAPQPGCFQFVQAGDSIKLSGTSFYGSCSVSIEGKTIPGVITESTNVLRFRIPKNHFGELNDNCKEKLTTIKIINGDGKTKEKAYHLSTSPPMHVNNASFNHGPFGGGDVNANLTVKGYSLYSSALIRVSGPLGYAVESDLGAMNYTDSVIVPIGLTGLGAGTYNVQIKKSKDDAYGFSLANFTLTK